MRPIAWLCLTVAPLLLSVGCAAPSLESEADDLRSEVSALPGVDTATLRYAEPVTLDSGKVALDVTMSPTASADQVTAVATTAYDAFRSTHHDEEADLSIRAGHSSVALRSFEPDASVTAVGNAVRTGLAAAPAGGSVSVDLTTQEVARGDHVAGTYVAALPAGSTAAQVRPTLASLEADHQESGLIGWGVAAADGASLSYDRGFPPAELVERWERLQAAGLPIEVRAVAAGGVFARGRLRAAYDVDDPAQRRALDRITHAQVRALGDGEWVYELSGPRGATVVSIDRFTCDLATADGRYDAALERWATARLGPCRSA